MSVLPLIVQLDSEPRGAPRAEVYIEPLVATSPGVSVVHAKDPLVYSIGTTVKVGDVTGRTLSRGRINGRYFEDAYVYPRTS